MTTLLVSSTGGHLRELHFLLPRIRGHDGDFVWVTNDTVQSRSLLEGEDVVYVPYLGSRNVTESLSMVPRAWSITGTRRYTSVISNGSGIALSFLPAARLRRIPTHYIECGTRVTGPSATGKALARIPGVTCYSQFPGWGPRWHATGSSLDGFVAVDREPRPIRKVVVTLGTWKQRFRSLLERLVDVVPAGAEVIWQTGFTDVGGLPIQPSPWLSPSELADALAAADLVVTHAGIGATIDALAAGKYPVLIPRRPEAGEQIDDHQLQLAHELARRGLATTCGPDDLTTEVLAAAAAKAVERRGPPPPISLVASGGAFGDS